MATLIFDPSGVARRQLHVILALDCSGSMRGDRIASLNYALRTALPELRHVAADNPEIDVRIRVVRFGTTAVWHVADAVPVDELKWTDVAAEGETHMGDALRLIAGVLTSEAMPGRQLPPVVVLASDGYPTDDIDGGLKAFFEAEHAASAIRLAIAIGSDVDEEILQRFIDHPEMKPMKATNASDLVHHIKWATTAPVKAVSSPTNAPDPLVPLAREADLAPTANSEIIW
ncbi:MAG: VWA domain-containing protein [Caulobacteraceae bacterium]|nr:MAG: VWA domain-containing protein [Caulobacteraceae bacterium]